MASPAEAIDLLDPAQGAATKSLSKSLLEKKLRLGAGGLPILEKKCKKTIKGKGLVKNWVEISMGSHLKFCAHEDACGESWHAGLYILQPGSFEKGQCSTLCF